MDNFQRGGNRGGGFRSGGGGGKPSFQKKSWGSDRGEREMFKATCDQCGKSCEVPFRPTGEKPVYCSDCFGSRRGESENGSASRFGSADRGPRRDFGDRSPRRDVPSGPASSDLQKQLTDISKKLDSLIHSIENMREVKKEVTIMKAIKAHEVEEVETAEPVKKVAKKKVAAKNKK